jgi:general secretion pathway protein C
MANTLISQLNNPAVLLRVNQRLASVMSLLLIVACAWLLVQITWLFFPQEEEQVLAVKQKPVSVKEKQEQQNNFRNLTSSNLFGVSQTTSTTKQTTAPETRLNLKLKGVLAAKPMKLASAIIAQGKSGKEDIYGVGDKIPGGVVIKEIHPEYVMLERNGQLETLKLEKISGLNNAGNTMGSGNTGPSHKLRSILNKTPGAALKEIRSNILKDPTSFGEYALPVVVKENGKQVGYRLKPQQKGDVLSQLGVQSTDIITEINGVKLDEPQNGISALRKLSTAKNINIVVKRNGAEVPLSITLP